MPSSQLLTALAGVTIILASEAAVLLPGVIAAFSIDVTTVTLVGETTNFFPEVMIAFLFFSEWYVTQGSLEEPV